jgi:hypothetical protein
MGVEMMPTLEALLVQSDFMTIHLPRTPETEGLIGMKELRMMKPGARLVNTARGGIVDEEALAKALEDGHLAGAALDVFAVEPTTDSPLFGMSNVVVAPHLGASTREAQDKAGTTVAEMVRLALKGEFVPYAVNVSAGAEVSEAVRLLGRAAGIAHRGARAGRGAERRGFVPREDCGARYPRPHARHPEGHLGPIRQRAGVVRQRADAGAGPRRHRERDALHREPGLRQPHLDPRGNR